MTKKTLLSLVTLFVVAILFSSVSHASGIDHTFAFKIGYQMFRSDDGWDETMVLGQDSSDFNGRNYSLEWDMYPADYFGLRFTLEYFKQNRYIEEYYGYDQYRYDHQRTMIIAPLTVSAKFKVPTPLIKPYFFAGFGFYYWGVYENIDDDGWFYNDDDDLRLIQEDDGVGFQVGTGIEFSLTRHIAFVMEGEYRSVLLEYEKYGPDTEVDASAILLTTGIMFK